eukprot:TRINITY_DN7658_c0_g1_i14.p2 TRINITY_DN7658_c0_g1~~TRINITY_DN7658_c0_g1_i14.p2  ORF type:complete len:130 (+),score=57.78 TRINITY_DN7658_c0_g1_i14:121-510(+)
MLRSLVGSEMCIRDRVKGVERLLKAEMEAKQIIQKAEEARQNKLKEARAAAMAEIESLRREEEKKFEMEVKRRFGSNQEEEDLGRKTKEEIEQIYRDYEQNKEQVISMLIERVMNVQLTFPKVLTGKFE